MFVGSKRHEAVEELVAAFDRATDMKRPEFVVIESETGLGKTRILQEFYATLAAQRQGNPPYWPARLDGHQSGDVLRVRKRITPALPFTIAGGAPLKYLWWGILCLESDDGLPVPRLVESARQFEIHAKHLSEEKTDHVDTALSLVQDVIEVVGLANPVHLAVSALDVAKTSASWLQRLRRKSKLSDQLAADRRVELTDDERGERLAAALRTASNAGMTAVIVVDDAHYADATLVSFLRQLSQISTGSVLVVMAAWPSITCHRMDGTSGTLGSLLESTRALMQERYSVIELNKLERQDVAALLLEAAPLTTTNVLERFCDAVDGNPLLLRLYLGLHAIKKDIQDGRLDTDPSVFGRLPADAKGVWQELWRQLPDRTRMALAIVSMQGPDFHPGFLLQAAADLSEFEVAREGIDDAQDVFGWVSAATDELPTFTERLRYEVAHENQSQQLDPSQVDVVRRALVTHAIEIRSSDEWVHTPSASRQTILRSHVSIVKADPSLDSEGRAAAAAFELSLLEEQLGDVVGAVASARDAVRLAARDGEAGTEALVAYRTRLGLLEREMGNDEAAFNEINAAEELSRELPGVDAEVTALLQDEVADLVVASPGSEKSDADPQPWLGWNSRDVPGIFEQPAREMAELIVEIVSAEGPVSVGRLQRLIGRSAGASRVGRVMQEQIDRAVEMADRRRQVETVTPFRGADAQDRIVALAGRPLVVVRERGDRALDEVPFTELASVAKNA